jgi:hypothetical protein
MTTVPFESPSDINWSNRWSTETKPCATHVGSPSCAGGRYGNGDPLIKFEMAGLSSPKETVRTRYCSVPAAGADLEGMEQEQQAHRGPGRTTQGASGE